MKRARGFTLIELMTVVVVVAILARIAIPMFIEQLRKGKRSEAIQALSDIALREEKWRSFNPLYATTASVIGSPGQVTAYNNGLKYYTISVSGNTATAYVITATRKGTMANDPKCANFVLRYGTSCAAAATDGLTNKCMSNTTNVDYCWRR